MQELLKSLQEKQEFTSSPGGCASVFLFWSTVSEEGLVIYTILPCVSVGNAKAH